MLVFETIQGITGNFYLDRLMVLGAEYLIFLVPLALIGLWFYSEDSKIDSLFSFSGALLGLALSFILGMVISHPAPYSQGFETLLVEAPENSFPSQHTVVVLGAALPLLWRRTRVGVLLLLTGIFTGFARVYTGLHFPIDILGSLLAALIGTSALYYQEEKLETVFGKLLDIEERIYNLIGVPKKYRSLKS